MSEQPKTAPEPKFCPMCGGEDTSAIYSHTEFEQIHVRTIVDRLIYKVNCKSCDSMATVGMYDFREIPE